MRAGEKTILPEKGKTSRCSDLEAWRFAATQKAPTGPDQKIGKLITFASKNDINPGYPISQIGHIIIFSLGIDPWIPNCDYLT